MGWGFLGTIAKGVKYVGRKIGRGVKKAWDGARKLGRNVFSIARELGRKAFSAVHTAAQFAKDRVGDVKGLINKGAEQLKKIPIVGDAAYKLAQKVAQTRIPVVGMSLSEADKIVNKGLDTVSGVAKAGESLSKDLSLGNIVKQGANIAKIQAGI